jgi:hypothetical protein
MSSRQDTGASVPDHALAVPATPLRVDGPAGFDPSRKAREISQVEDLAAMLLSDGDILDGDYFRIKRVCEWARG